MLTQQKGHFYVCGDCAMAEDVANTLRLVFQKAGGMDHEESEAFLVNLRVRHYLIRLFFFNFNKGKRKMNSFFSLLFSL